MAGVGNINTAEFWEYDARLGRRWNVDPVLKVELSSFGCFSNNPITRIDPKGDDDFFDANGNLVLHTNSGNSVFIIECSLKEFVDAHYRATLKYKEINLQSAYLRAYGTSVEKVKLNGDPKDPNTIAINNIIWHYFKKAKVDEINVTRFGFGSIDDKTLAQTGSSLGGIDFNLINSSLHPLLNTSNNIINVLVHERYHNWGDKKSGPNESTNHLNAYIAQMGHESWDGTKCVVLQDDVIKMLVEKDIFSQTIFARKWLDVEGIYSEAGWKVKYESPDRGEDFDSYFTFKK